MGYREDPFVITPERGVPQSLAAFYAFDAMSRMQQERQGREL